VLRTRAKHSLAPSSWLSLVKTTTQKAYALTFLAYHYAARAELRRASEISQDLYELSQDARNTELECVADHLIGDVALRMGEFRKAEQFLGAMVNEARRVPIGGSAFLLRGHALVSRGNALWHLGFPDQALALYKRRHDVGVGPRCD